ncbi:FRG domain-containing protein [Citrobacter sp. MGH 55]|uniref:FRG domain-containing protein n=1 Tax=Citrobacter sp. MGH 55 TaxID=1439319 RepID=UPI0009E2ABF9|nr:FRG domain-containing protein [Citrobacter sp. MGH 55]
MFQQLCSCWLKLQFNRKGLVAVTPEYLEKLARPEEVEVSSVPEFLAVIQDAVPNGADGSPDFDSFIYRGVADSLSHKLVPSLFRNPKILEDFSVGEGLTKWGVLEQSLLRRFKEGARPYLSIAPKDDIEWLILARHHGLPTRVMDWSKNPLVALHFAIDGDHAESPAVWQAMLWRAALVGQTYSLVQLNHEFARSDKHAFAYYQGPVTNRAVAQQGVLTIHQLPDQDLPFTSVNEQQVDSSGFLRVSVR